MQFKNRSVYLYTYESAGKYNIEEMKSLAEAGDGLKYGVFATCTGSEGETFKLDKK